MADEINIIPGDFMGVSLSQAQKDLLINDNKSIGTQLDSVNYHRGQHEYYDSLYHTALNRDCGQNKIPHKNEYAACMQKREAELNEYGSKSSSEYALWQSSQKALDSAIKKYNNDLESIQNTIKLQIQSQQANTNAAQTSPGAILATNAQQIQAEKEKSELKAKQLNDTLKLGVFVVIVIIVIWGGIKIFKSTV